MYDLIEAARIKAIRPDDESFIRTVYRWYSKEFSTPLHTLDDLPLDEILLHYFESAYLQLKPEERHDLAVKIIETPEEKELREAEDKKSEEELLEMAKVDNERVKAKIARAKQMLDSLKEMGSVGPNSTPQNKPKERKAILPIPEEEEVKVSFEDESNLMLDRGFGPPPKSRKGK
jgi:hypothetical protein